MEKSNIFEKIGAPTPKWAKWAAGISTTIGTVAGAGAVFSNEIGVPENMDSGLTIVTVIGYVFAVLFGKQVDQDKLKKILDERKKNDTK